MIVAGLVLVGKGSPGPEPTLGLVWGSNQHGYGLVRPATIDNGGDPTGLVTGVQWQSWGGDRAIGSGNTTYVGPDQIAANGTQETATVVAFNLGTCQGKPGYRAVEWYFPQHGGSFTPRADRDICRGTAAIGPVAPLGAPATTTTPTAEPATVPSTVSTTTSTTKASAATDFAVFVQRVQVRIRTIGAPPGPPVPDAVVTCPTVHPTLAAGVSVGCKVASPTVGGGVVLVRVVNAGGVDFNLVVGSAFMCRDTTPADQRALSDDLGMPCIVG